jgi:sialidase-1
MRIIPIVALLAVWPASAQLVQANIFEAAIGGYAHYRVPAIAVSSRGTVMAFAEARKNTRGDWGRQDIVMRRSRDKGVNWDAPRIIARLDQPGPKNPVAVAQKLGVDGEVTYNNVVPIVDGGTLHVLFCVEYARCYWMQSVDDGSSFSRPVDVTKTFEEFRKDYDWKVIATGPGHGIKLKNGRLLVPVWLSDGTGGHAHRPSIVAVIYSDTGGKS